MCRAVVHLAIGTLGHENDDYSHNPSFEPCERTFFVLVFDTREHIGLRGEAHLFSSYSAVSVNSVVNVLSSVQISNRHPPTPNLRLSTFDCLLSTSPHFYLRRATAYGN
jgi:hypothetical protein